MNIIEKTQILASFVEALANDCDEPRRQTALNVCGTARYLAYLIYWEDDDSHPEYLEAYSLIYNEALRTLRWYVKELQWEDKLSRKHKVARRPRRIVSKELNEGQRNLP